jgi:hypothetical protein
VLHHRRKARLQDGCLELFGLDKDGIRVEGTGFDGVHSQQVEGIVLEYDKSAPRPQDTP